MKVLIPIIYFGSLAMSFITGIIYTSITMPVLCAAHKRSVNEGQDNNTEINKISLDAAYAANRPLFLSRSPFLFLNTFIKYGSLFFFSIFSFMAIHNSYLQTKTLLIPAGMAFMLFCFYRIKMIIEHIIVKKLFIK